MKCQSLLLIYSLLLSSCITNHFHPPTHPSNNKLAISCSAPDWLTKNHANISCTIENITDDWVEFKAEAALVIAQEKFKTLTAEETQNFLTAYQFQKQSDSYNTTMLLAGLIVTSAIVTGSTPNSSAAMLATGIGASAVGASFAHETYNHHSAIQKPIYGSEHLLGQAAKIPPNMYVRKKLIVEASHASQASEHVQICLSAPVEECIQTGAPTGNGRRRVTAY